MTLKKRSAHKSVTEMPLEEAKKMIRWFEAEIVKNEDIVYGVALFFECLALFHAGHDAIVETCRKQFRNIIQTGKADSERAEAVLDQVRKQPGQAVLLRDFQFAHCQGHPQADEMLKRAKIMVKTYEETFPGRPRSRPFQEKEIFRLLEAASDKL